MVDDGEAAAAAFYAKMEKPTPPQGESVLAAVQAEQERGVASDPSRGIPPGPFIAPMARLTGPPMRATNNPRRTGTSRSGNGRRSGPRRCSATCRWAMVCGMTSRT